MSLSFQIQRGTHWRRSDGVEAFVEGVHEGRVLYRRHRDGELMRCVVEAFRRRYSEVRS